MSKKYRYNDGERTAEGRKKVDDDYKKTHSIIHKCSVKNIDYIIKKLGRHNLDEKKYHITAFATLAITDLSLILFILSNDVKSHDDEIKKMGRVNAETLKEKIKELWKANMGEEF